MDLLAVVESKIIPVIISIVDNSTANYTIHTKAQGNFVTSADIQIEEKLKIFLSDLIPCAGFIAEESENIDADYVWVIDPIDGTGNFINGLDYSCSVALKYNNDILLGIVYCPTKRTVYYAVKNKGSYSKTNNKRTRLKVKNFSKNEGIAIFGVPYNRNKIDKIFDVAKDYYKHASNLIRIGPASVDICRVASGIAKIYFELDLQEWDIAAGRLILEEAGGYYKKIDDLMIFSAYKQ